MSTAAGTPGPPPSRNDATSILDATYIPAMAPSNLSARSTAGKQQRYAERDRQIRDAARRLLVERGLHGFSMEDVADAIAYSKGTVYQHYESKEDALVASCAESGTRLAALFERAAALPGTSRERMIAIVEAYCLFVERHPVPFRVIPLVHSPTVFEKASPARILSVEAAHERVRGACAAVVEWAVARGDLVPGPGIDARTIPFALWAMMLGSFLLTELHSSDKIFGVDDPAAAIRTQWAVYLDGLGWRPPRGEFDEDAAARRIRSLLEAPTDAPPTS